MILHNIFTYKIWWNLIWTQIMRLDSSFESLSGLGGGRSGSVADLADETPRRPIHRHSYAAPAHNDPDIATPTKPFGLGELSFIILTLIINMDWITWNNYFSISVLKVQFKQLSYNCMRFQILFMQILLSLSMSH